MKYECGCSPSGTFLLPACPIHGKPLAGMREGFRLRGAFRAQLWQGRQFLRDLPFQNTVMTAGITHMLATQFTGSAQITTWYFGLIDTTAFTEILAADTMGSHAGWTESTAYAEAARQAWAAVSGAAMAANTTEATFTANAATTLQGAFITSSSTKGGSTGTLWSAGSFSVPQGVAAGQAIRLSYVVSGS